MYALTLAALGFSIYSEIMGGTDMRQQQMKEILAKDGNAYFHDLAHAARKAMQKDVEEAIKVFYGLDK